MKNILEINGMICEHCAQRVTKAIKSIDGVESVEVDFNTKKAIVISDDVTVAQIKNIIEEAGYEIGSVE